MVREEGRIYHTARMSFFWFYVVCMIGLLASIYMYMNGGYYPFLFVSLLVIIALALMEIKIKNNKVILREDHMKIETGLLSKKRTRINYQNITDTRIEQSFMQRVFGFGDIEIGVPGSIINRNINQKFMGIGDVKINDLGATGRGG